MTDLSIIAAKAFNDEVSHTEFNALVAAAKELQKTERAFPVAGIATGYDIAHNFGTSLGLTANQFFLEARAYDSNGDLVGGVRAAKTTSNIATLVIDANLVALTGTVILKAVLY